MTRTKIGIVGCGYWGAKHVRSLHELGICDLVACDSNRELLMNLQRKYPSVATTDRYQDLLDSDVAGIIVATPMATHFDLARQCLLHGKDVLVEKPLTTNARQAEELVETAERRRAVLMVGHTFVYNPAVEAVLELISSGELGDIYYLDSARLNLGLFQHDANVMWDLAPHDLSILLYLLGQAPTHISARGAAHVNRKVHDNAHLDLTFPGGTAAHVHVSWLEPCKMRRTTVVGNRKMVVYDDVAPAEKVWVFDKGITLDYHTDSYDDFHLSYRCGNTTILHTSSDEPLQIEQRHFVECIQERWRPKSDGFAGMQVVKLLECAQRSLDLGGGFVEVGPLIACPDPHLGAGTEQIVELGITSRKHHGGVACGLVDGRT